jgi:hypothetical protein
VEYLLVRYPAARAVLVDGAFQGWTNVVLPLDAGTYTVTLGPPPDFAPLEQRIHLEYTSILTPYRITFEPLPPSARGPGRGPA